MKHEGPAGLSSNSHDRCRAITDNTGGIVQWCASLFPSLKETDSRTKPTLFNEHRIICGNLYLSPCCYSLTYPKHQLLIQVFTLWAKIPQSETVQNAKIGGVLFVSDTKAVYEVPWTKILERCGVYRGFKQCVKVNVGFFLLRNSARSHCEVFSMIIFPNAGIWSCKSLCWFILQLRVPMEFARLDNSPPNESDLPFLLVVMKLTLLK